MALKKDPREKQSEKIVTYVTPAERKIAERRAKREGFSSVSSWAYRRLEAELKSV